MRPIILQATVKEVLFPCVEMDLLNKNPHTAFMQTENLTEEKYYELYSQMEGIIRYVGSLDTNEVGRPFRLRTRLKKVPLMRENKPQDEFSG
ncbi:MAG: hypothetical protein NTV68_05375 [Methanomicrobiales archaeon]|nr:hypothetical protein [Methanomicrobiales archaeon]